MPFNDFSQEHRDIYLRLKFRAANESNEPLFFDPPKKNASQIPSEDLLSMINALDFKIQLMNIRQLNDSWIQKIQENLISLTNEIAFIKSKANENVQKDRKEAQIPNDGQK